MTYLHLLYDYLVETRISFSTPELSLGIASAKGLAETLCRNLASKQKYTLMDTKKNCSYHACNLRDSTFTRFREMLNLKRFKTGRKVLVSEALAKSAQCVRTDDQEELP